ncbi:hypothetical protein [Pseudomonas putida]|uniref:hypothetical protein n=1 Tax=Pseudomonas putida TaxID=303 RepID=UPI00235DC280|nr:hypothetical protein [Pseudomonas putida]GLO48544.1 hypothetical protein PPUN109347_51090 [Pseudomonas putida]HDS0982483.1 hypothetical protein [Pseudomonas putida]
MRNGKSDTLFPPPWVEGSLENLEGGAQNVIPLELLEKPLRVDVTPWPGSNPAPGMPETLVLLCDGVQIGEPRQWEAPIDPDDYYVEIPLLHLREDSTPELIYRVTGYNGAEGYSEPLIITLDLTGPRLGGDGGGLIFEAEVLTDGVTADYLKRHNDVLVAGVPNYHAFVPGDHIRWFWDTALYEDDLAGEKVLKQGDFPVTLEISGDTIRDRGDGERFVHYRLHDYAGNKSSPEEPKVVQLKAKTAPLPRELGWPEIAHATGSGQQVELDPNKKLNYMRVTVPSGAAFPGERVEVLWGEPGGIGSYLATEEASGFPGQYDIPLNLIAQHSGKVLEVSFQVTDENDKVHPSDVRLVSFLPLTQGLPTPNIPQPSATHGTVYLSNVPAEGMVITVNAWRYIHTDHRVTLVVSGVDAQGNAQSEEVLKAHAVTPEQVMNGLGFDDMVKATKPFLLTLKRDKLSVRVTVSFDQGQTWPSLANFPLLGMDLRD